MVQALSVFFFGARQELVHAVVRATGRARDCFGFSVVGGGACQELVHAVVGPSGGARDFCFVFFSSLQRNSSCHSRYGWLFCTRRLSGGGGGRSDGTTATV